jgi:hypothetical protein
VTDPPQTLQGSAKPANGLPDGSGLGGPGAAGGQRDCETALRGRHARGHRDPLVEQGRRDPLMPRTAGPYSAGPPCAPPARGPAGSRTRAGPRPPVASASAGCRSCRSRRAACGRAAPRCQPARLGAGRSPPRAAPRPHNATRCSPPARMHIVLPREPGQPGPQMLPVRRHYPTRFTSPVTASK